MDAALHGVFLSVAEISSLTGVATTNASVGRPRNQENKGDVLIIHSKQVRYTMGYLIAQCFRLAASVLQACRALFLRVLPTLAKSAKVPIFHIADDAL